MMMQKEIYQLSPLFEDVQLLPVFTDGKTFVDCVPKISPQSILDTYNSEKNKPGFDLKAFVEAHFDLPKPHSDGHTSDPQKTVEENIEILWDVLSRQPDAASGTLIPLPHPYIVPGGRFGEVYYWDSYFTMLGLQASGRHHMLENMVANFSHLIETVGFIPNGNRTYYLGRSQPPFYALMIRLLAAVKGEKILSQYLLPLLQEYRYWMKGQEVLVESNSSVRHVHKMKGGEVLNRYWDEFDTARPESYRQDVELAHQSKQDPAILYRHLRAGAESGWDYSSRWFKDGHSFSTIHTAAIVPVDLNCLLYHLEQTIASAYLVNDEAAAAAKYTALAEKRKQAIQQYCWNERTGFFVDFDTTDNRPTQELTLAGIAPLYFKIATQQQADLAAAIIEQRFLKPGGLITTLKQTGQQWDAPNGWAPLQWMAVVGLDNYGHVALAATIAQRWLQLNTDVFKRTGKLMEKYNVVDTAAAAGGGEYEGQDGFGWTNGVYLALKKRYG
jgi:alpha,alpha-trehalase